MANEADQAVANWERQMPAVEEAMKATARYYARLGYETYFAPRPSWRYPHTCPRCSGPAYVGAVKVDCAGNCK